MIPKVLHYCWFGGNPLPREVRQCINSWKKFCPDYEICCWDESNFDISIHPFIKDAYDNKAWAFVSDYARLWVIWNHGGIYLDTDVEIKRTPDFLLEHAAFFGTQQVDKLVNTGLCFGAEAGHPVIKAMLEEYDGIVFDPEKKTEFACPILNTRALESFGYRFSTVPKEFDAGICVYPPQYFDPLSPGESENLLCKDTVSVHHYSASWQSASKRWRRRVIRLIGEERIHIIKQRLRR